MGGHRCDKCNVMCTCGSGMHPRHCEAHPLAYQRHVDELNWQQAAEDKAHEEGIAQGRKEEREAAVALLDRAYEKHKSEPGNVGSYLANLRVRLQRGEHRKGGE